MAAGPPGGAAGADDQTPARAWPAQEDREALQVLPDEARPDRGDDRPEAQRTVRHPVSQRAGNALSRGLDHSAQDPEAKDYRTKPDRMRMMQAASWTQPRKRRPARIGRK